MWSLVPNSPSVPYFPGKIPPFCSYVCQTQGMPTNPLALLGRKLWPPLPHTGELSGVGLRDDPERCRRTVQLLMSRSFPGPLSHCPWPKNTTQDSDKDLIRPRGVPVTSSLLWAVALVLTPTPHYSITLPCQTRAGRWPDLLCHQHLMDHDACSTLLC